MLYFPKIMSASIVLLGLGLGTAGSVQAAILEHCQPAQAALAKDVLDREQAELEVGRGTTWDVGAAQYFYTEMRFCSGELSKAEFCQQQAVNAADLQNGLKAAAEEGRVGLDRQIDAIRAAVELDNFCGRSAK